MKPRQDQPDRTHKKILITSLSAMVAESATFPIDLTKTRIQLNRRESGHPTTNALRVAASIVRQQGPLGLYQGLSPAVIRHLFNTPIRIVGYEHLRDLFQKEAISADGSSSSLSLFRKALVGGVSGAFAQGLGEPQYMEKGCSKFM